MTGEDGGNTVRRQDRKEMGQDGGRTGRQARPDPYVHLGLTQFHILFSFAKYETVQNRSLFHRVSIVSQN